MAKRGSWYTLWVVVYVLVMLTNKDWLLFIIFIIAGVQSYAINHITDEGKRLYYQGICYVALVIFIVVGTIALIAYLATHR